MQRHLKSLSFTSATLLLCLNPGLAQVGVNSVAQPAPPNISNQDPPPIPTAPNPSLSPITPPIPAAPNSSLSPLSPPVNSIPNLSPGQNIIPQPQAKQGSLSPIEISIPSLSPDRLPSASPTSPLVVRNQIVGSVLTIDIPCQDLVENIQAKLAACQKFLAIHKQIGDRAGESATLNNIGLIYRDLGDYNQALSLYQEALVIQTKIGNQLGEAATLNNIGLTYHELGDYAQALKFYQAALVIHQKFNSQENAARTLNNLGELYRQLGQYSQSLAYYQQALEAVNQTKDKINIGNTLHNLGLLYDKQQQDDQALKYYQQALEIRREINDRAGEATTLNNIGLVRDRNGNHTQALASLKQALAIFEQLGNRPNIGNTLDSIGTVYKNLGEFDLALESYQKSLAIIRKVGHREIERVTLANIAALFEKQNKPGLAIVFYKQSVNVTEGIRDNLKQLRSEQESYTQTVADTYRSLADLLLSQGRVLEAQQVLELLKIQEIREYTRSQKAGDNKSAIAFNPTEAIIINSYGTLIAFGQQVDECKKIQCSQLEQLNHQLQTINEQYNQTVQSLQKEISDRRSQDLAFFDPNKLAKATEIVESQPGTVLIYPFVLQDKIWLLWASKGGIVKSIELPISRQKLGETVLKFRQLMQDQNSDIAEFKAAGKQLYDWLIKPIEPELKANQIQNLVFSLDRVTRYIPMSALYDGEQYLLENYAVSTVLSAELTDVREKLPANPQNTSVLALGLSDPTDEFGPLPNVPIEIDAVVRQNPSDRKGIYPGLTFLNQAFNLQALHDHLAGKNILHVATHGRFVRGKPEESYLLLGTGEKLTMPQIETLPNLSNIHLVVLSACETALGGLNQDGVEIAGMSYYFISQGVKAAIASLWKVNDKSTSILMENFYNKLAKGTLTKAEALRQAQLELLQGNRAVEIDSGERVASQSSVAATSGNKFAHPYYWAPFILIGNGL